MIAVRHRLSTIAVALAALAWLLGPAIANAQGNCNMHRLAGNYVFESHGSITWALSPSPPVEWSLTTRPLIFVASIGILPDGAMSGWSWVILGSVASVIEGVPFVGQLVELDEEACTAVLEWLGHPVPGKPGALHRERVLFVDNGREFRSMLKSSPSGTMAWIGRGYRMTPENEIGNCGPHQLAGDVLLQCEGLGIGGETATAASIATLTVAHDGSFSGTMYSKHPTYAEGAAEGTFVVQPDCSVEVTIESAAEPGYVHQGRGVIFDSGKRGILILPFQTTLPDGSTVKPAYARCELLSLGR